MESRAQRFNRDWLQIRDDRKIRGFDQRSKDRKDRDFPGWENGDNPPEEPGYSLAGDSVTIPASAFTYFESDAGNFSYAPVKDIDYSHLYSVEYSGELGDSQVVTFAELQEAYGPYPQGFLLPLVQYSFTSPFEPNLIPDQQFAYQKEAFTDPQGLKIASYQDHQLFLTFSETRITDDVVVNKGDRKINYDIGRRVWRLGEAVPADMFYEISAETDGNLKFARFEMLYPGEEYISNVPVKWGAVYNPGTPDTYHEELYDLSNDNSLIIEKEYTSRYSFDAEVFSRIFPGSTPGDGTVWAYGSWHFVIAIDKGADVESATITKVE